MARSRILWLVLAAGVFIVMLMAWAPWRAQEGGRTSADQHLSAAPAPATGRSPSEDRAVREPVARIHLQVPENTPVVTVLDRLKSAADAGDSRAACRLGVELARCVRLGSASSAQDKRLCEGVAPNDVDLAWKYLFRSAAMGNVAAMSRYVRDPGLTTTNPADSAEGWLLYKQNAPSFLAQAVRRGDVMALYFSWWTSATGFSSGGDHVFQQDPYMAIVYGSAVLPLLDPRRQGNVVRLDARIQASLTADQIAKAQAEGQRIRDTYFAGAARTEDTADDSYLQPAQCDN